MFRRVLVANRGEIAVRVLRTCRGLGIEGVAVHSDADAGALHVRRADRAVRLGPAPATESYLDVDRIVQAARDVGADAVHPGYGFLSENPALPQALDEVGITFVGPRAEVIRLMGDKAAAKEAMAAAGVPVVPGIDVSDLTDDEVLARLGEVGFPLVCKAVAGGGGRGMRVVHDPADAADALAAARREANNAFGDDRMIIERLVTDPRHVEVQVVGDAHGTVLHVLERDCSIQRRHQKVVEEAPAAHLAADVRARLHQAGVAAAAAVDYVGAGTVEFLLDANGTDFHFIEMNTRLQVEHPVTELITGLDLVELQLRVAAGEPLGTGQDEITADGHAIEARVYAEDPAVGFLPQTGTLHAVAVGGTGSATSRVDSGVEAGDAVSSHYDPMLAKLVVHAADRDAAVSELRELVRSTVGLGVRTNLEWLGDLLEQPAVVGDDVTTDWLDGWSWSPPVAPDTAVAAAAVALAVDAVDGRGTSPWDTLGPLRTGGSGWVVTLEDRDDVHRVEVVRRAPTDWEVALTRDLPAGRTRRCTVRRHGDRWLVTDASDHTAEVTVAVSDGTAWVHADGRTRALRMRAAARHRDLGAAGGETALVSPMPGSVVDVGVADGDEVTAGQSLLVVEAMKMEHPITAPVAGTVADLAVAVGDPVEAGQPLVAVHPSEDG